MLWRVRDMPNHGCRPAWFSIMLLALLHGGLYASFLPPWGLIDEEQHVHYVQYLAEQRAIPTVGQTYLSPEIVESLFATRRWEAFHWPTPASHDPREMGREGHSYEGLQPPFFYILLAPLYTILPNDMLAKVYGLRWAMVGISLLTVWMVYRIAVELFPQQRVLPCVASLLIVMMPERTASVSRVNNDVLLEVIATAFIWVCTRAMLRGLSIRQSQLLGLLLGLGMVTKTSMAMLVVLLPFVFLINRRASNWRLCAVWTGGTPLVLLAVWFVYNLLPNGDLSNWRNFQKLMILPAPQLTLLSVITASWESFRHFWVVWWKGAVAASNPIVDVLLLALAVLSVLSLVGLVRQRRQSRRNSVRDGTQQVVWVYLIVVGIYELATLMAYFNENLPLVRPVINVRFLLPAVAPAVILFSWGLWNSPVRTTGLIAAIGVLLVLDALSLFGNLLPYFYYWSAFVVSGIAQPRTVLGLREAWALFYPRFLADKPALLQPVVIWLLPLYIGSLAIVGVMLRRARRAQ